MITVLKSYNIRKAEDHCFRLTFAMLPLYM